MTDERMIEKLAEVIWRSETPHDNPQPIPDRARKWVEADARECLRRIRAAGLVVVDHETIDHKGS